KATHPPPGAVQLNGRALGGRGAASFLRGGVPGVGKRSSASTRRTNDLRRQVRFRGPTRGPIAAPRLTATLPNHRSAAKPPPGGGSGPCVCKPRGRKVPHPPARLAKFLRGGGGWHTPPGPARRTAKRAGARHPPTAHCLSV